MRYQCFQREYGIDGYTITTLREEDIMLIKDWRNQQMDALRQNTPLTEDMQRRYYHEVVVPTFTQTQPSQILVSYLLHGECIGYGGLTNINWEAKRAEVSFLVATERHADHHLYQHELRIFFTMIRDLAFNELGLNRIFTETYDFRPYVIEAVEQFGLRLEGRLRQHVLINGRYTDSLIHSCLKSDVPV